MTSIRRGRALVVTVLLSAAAVLAVAAPAAAHAVLVSSDPADGSRLEASPVQVTLHFDEAVQLVPGGITALSSHGTRVDSGPPRLTDHGVDIVLPLRPDLPRDSYTVSWRAVSDDSHVVAGSISFGVRQNARPAGPATAEPLTPVDIIADAATGLGYLGAVLAFGIAALGRLFWPWTLRTRRLRTLGWAGLGALALGALLELLLQGPRATGSGLTGALHLDDLGQTLSSPYGIALLVRLVLLVALAALRPWRATARPSAWVPRLVLAVGVLTTIAVSGHAAVGADAALAIPVAILHLAAMCIWLGGLVSLAVIVLPRAKAAGRIHPRLMLSWSIAAFVSVAVLIVTGEYQAWREVQPVPALWSTDYGITLLIKLGLVIVALVVALAVRYRAISPRPGATMPFRTARRSILVETVIVALVVGVTTVLVAQPPASATYRSAGVLPDPTPILRGGLHIERNRTMQNTFAVSGMTCEHCDHHVGEALAAIDGVESVTADYRTGDATVVSSRPLDEGEVSAALEEAGYALA